MKYIHMTQSGGPEVLEVREGEMPRPGPGQVLIEVAASGVNRPDVLQRKGLYPPPPGASPVPGLEVAGEVVALGEGVDAPALGDRVCALLTGGGYAQYAVAEAPLCLPLPAGLDCVAAAALPETFYTVWSNLFDRAGLRRGEQLLVHGGGSGIGTTAVQLGKAFGAVVHATAGSAEKCAAVLALGADSAINYREQDFVVESRAASGGHGMDVILDMVAGDYLPRDMEAAAEDGRIVIIAVLGGARAGIDCSRILRKRLVITGSTLRNRPLAFKADIAAALRREVWPLLESGKVKPVIYQTFPLAEAAEAHRLMESSRHIGKLVLV